MISNSIKNSPCSPCKFTDEISKRTIPSISLEDNEFSKNISNQYTRKNSGNNLIQILNQSFSKVVGNIINQKKENKKSNSICYDRKTPINNSNI